MGLNVLEIIGTVVGLVYLWLEYKASIYLWIAGIVMPAIYIVVYYRAGLFADFGINVYYLMASVYGWCLWQLGKKGKDDTPKEFPITHTPLRFYIRLAGLFVVLWLLFAWVLITFTSSDVAWFDSFTTALSVIGLWMLARKYVEQWLAWVLVDLVSSVLYVYKGLYFTSALYALYTVIALFGYWKWKKQVVTG